MSLQESCCSSSSFKVEIDLLNAQRWSGWEPFLFRLVNPSRLLFGSHQTHQQTLNQSSSRSSVQANVCLHVPALSPWGTSRFLWPNSVRNKLRWLQGQPALQKAPACTHGSRRGERPQRLQPVSHQSARMPSSTRGPQEILEKIKEKLFVLKINATKARLKGNNLLCAGHKTGLFVFVLFFNGALCLQHQSGCHQHGTPWRRFSVYLPLADDRRPLSCMFVLMGPLMSFHGNTWRFKQQQTRRSTNSVHSEAQKSKYLVSRL